MKMVKSLLLGAAAGMVGVAGAQAADLPVKAKPVQYVKICSLYGAGFYYMPGTDTCIKIGGFVRAEVNVLAGGSFAVMTSGDFNSNSNASLTTWRSRAGVTFDTRSQTEYGTLRSYFIVATTSTNSQSGGNGATNGLGAGNPGGSGSDPYTRLWSNAAFIQFAGFTAGKTGSFFDFDLQPYSNQTNFWGSNLAGGGIEVFAYTAQFGNGLSASIAAENPNGHRISILSTPNGAAAASGNTGTNAVTSWVYANQQVPDLVGNLRIDQAWGSAQIMGAYHQLIANSTGAAAGNEMDDSGWAFGAGLKLNAPMLGKGDYVQAQFTYAKGASLYGASGAAGGFALTSNHGTTLHSGILTDAVIANNGIDRTQVWSVTGGYEHFWNTQWKTSLYGAYGKVEYSDTACNVLRPATAAAATSCNWDYWQVGSRTVWTPVTNLDLSLEVMYNKLDSAFQSAGGVYADKDWVSGIFRVQRNFYP
ncbi:MAG TPA: porin [Pseudolabrys sp.]|nr:porin [Pseudolabrys sp.]